MKITPIIRDCYNAWGGLPPIHLPWNGRGNQPQELGTATGTSLQAILPTECTYGDYILAAYNASEGYARSIRVEEEKSVPETYRLTAAFINKHYAVLEAWGIHFRGWMGVKQDVSKETMIAWLKEHNFYGITPVADIRKVPDMFSGDITATLLVDSSYRGVVVYNNVQLLRLTWNSRE